MRCELCRERFRTGERAVPAGYFQEGSRGVEGIVPDDTGIHVSCLEEMYRKSRQVS